MLILPKFIRESDLDKIPPLPNPEPNKSIEDGIYYAETLETPGGILQDLTIETQRQAAQNASQWICSLIAVSEGECNVIQLWIIRTYTMNEILAELEGINAE